MWTAGLADVLSNVFEAMLFTFVQASARLGDAFRGGHGVATQPRGRPREGYGAGTSKL